jgi:hypothetical protein
MCGTAAPDATPDATTPQGEERADFNDEAEVAAARKRQELAVQQERLREAYNELKYTAPDKVEAMRDQEMTRMQMSLAYRTGEALPPRLFWATCT